MANWLSCASVEVGFVVVSGGGDSTTAVGAGPGLGAAGATKQRHEQRDSLPVYYLFHQLAHQSLLPRQIYSQELPPGEH